VLSIKYIYTNNLWFALVIIWDTTQSQTTLMGVNLADMQESPLVSEAGKSVYHLF